MSTMHKNDKGIDIGDEAYALVYGWIPLRVKVIDKYGSGMTRVMKVEPVDWPASIKTDSRTTDSDYHKSWYHRFSVSVKRMEPL